MKKTIIALSIIILILTLNKKDYEIPKESIRFRVIANTNNYHDQTIKKEIVKNLKKELIKNNPVNIEEERAYLTENLHLFTNVVDKTLKDNNSNETFHINYGKNYFPKKEYQNVTYPEGEYESLVVTLGDGDGNNFWCVLFPPLCFDDNKDYQYKSFIKEIIDKIFE